MENITSFSLERSGCDFGLFYDHGLDLIYDVFVEKMCNDLSFKDLKELAQVNKMSNKTITALMNDPDTYKELIYKTATFNPQDWATHYGLDGIAVSESAEARKTLPDNIIEIFNRLGKTHLFVWLPESVDLYNYGELLKQKFPEHKETYGKLWGNLGSDYRFTFTKTSKWIAFPTKPIAGSQDLNFTEQSALVENQEDQLLDPPSGIQGLKKCRVAKKLEAIICVTSHFFKTGVKIFHKHYLRCQETIENWNACVGFAASSGLPVIAYPMGDDDKLGVAGLLKFTSKPEIKHDIVKS